MATIKYFEDLEIWQEARRLSQEIIRISKETDLKSDFRLRDQIKASAGSVMDNIAEGFERNGNKEFVHFLSIAKGSAGEVRSQLFLALDLNYTTKAEFDIIYELSINISKQIQGFMNYLKNSGMKGEKYLQN